MSKIGTRPSSSYKKKSQSYSMNQFKASLHAVFSQILDDKQQLEIGLREFSYLIQVHLSKRDTLPVVLDGLIDISKKYTLHQKLKVLSMLSIIADISQANLLDCWEQICFLFQLLISEDDRLFFNPLSQTIGDVVQRVFLHEPGECGYSEAKLNHKWKMLLGLFLEYLQGIYRKQTTEKKKIICAMLCLNSAIQSVPKRIISKECSAICLALIKPIQTTNGAGEYNNYLLSCLLSLVIACEEQFAESCQASLPIVLQCLQNEFSSFSQKNKGDQNCMKLCLDIMYSLIIVTPNQVCKSKEECVDLASLLTAYPLLEIKKAAQLVVVSLQELSGTKQQRDVSLDSFKQASPFQSNEQRLMENSQEHMKMKYVNKEQAGYSIKIREESDMQMHLNQQEGIRQNSDQNANKVITYSAVVQQPSSERSQEYQMNNQIVRNSFNNKSQSLEDNTNQYNQSFQQDHSISAANSNQSHTSTPHSFRDFTLIEDSHDINQSNSKIQPKQSNTNEISLIKQTQKQQEQVQSGKTVVPDKQLNRSNDSKKYELIPQHNYHHSHSYNEIGTNQYSLNTIDCKDMDNQKEYLSVQQQSAHQSKGGGYSSNSNNQKDNTQQVEEEKIRLNSLNIDQQDENIHLLEGEQDEENKSQQDLEENVELVHAEYTNEDSKDKSGTRIQSTRQKTGEIELHKDDLKQQNEIKIADTTNKVIVLDPQNEIKQNDIDISKENSSSKCNTQLVQENKNNNGQDQQLYQSANRNENITDRKSNSNEKLKEGNRLIAQEVGQINPDEKENSFFRTKMFNISSTQRNSYFSPIRRNNNLIQSKHKKHSPIFQKSPLETRYSRKSTKCTQTQSTHRQKIFQQSPFRNLRTSVSPAGSSISQQLLPNTPPHALPSQHKVHSIFEQQIQFPVKSTRTNYMNRSSNPFSPMQQVQEEQKLSYQYQKQIHSQDHQNVVPLRNNSRPELLLQTDYYAPECFQQNMELSNISRESSNWLPRLLLNNKQFILHPNKAIPQHQILECIHSTDKLNNLNQSQISQQSRVFANGDNNNNNNTLSSLSLGTIDAERQDSEQYLDDNQQLEINLEQQKKEIEVINISKEQEFINQQVNDNSENSLVNNHESSQKIEANTNDLNSKNILKPNNEHSKEIQNMEKVIEELRAQVQELMQERIQKGLEQTIIEQGRQIVNIEKVLLGIEGNSTLKRIQGTTSTDQFNYSQQQKESVSQINQSIEYLASSLSQSSVSQFQLNDQSFNGAKQGIKSHQVSQQADQNLEQIPTNQQSNLNVNELNKQEYYRQQQNSQYSQQQETQIKQAQQAPDEIVQQDQQTPLIKIVEQFQDLGNKIPEEQIPPKQQTVMKNESNLANQEKDSNKLNADEDQDGQVFVDKTMEKIQLALQKSQKYLNCLSQSDLGQRSQEQSVVSMSKESHFQNQIQFQDQQEEEQLNSSVLGSLFVN